MQLTAEELAAQLNDPDCDHVGPFMKCGDNQNDIDALLWEHGLVVDDNGWAQPRPVGKDAGSAS